MRSTLYASVLILLVTASASFAAGQASDRSRVQERDASSNAASATQPEAESELEKGTALTRIGSFSAAIPHLLAARGKVANNYAASFNLALCYVATDRGKLAIPILDDLRAHGHDSTEVNNLLAQAYVGDSQDEQALDALRHAASLNPLNEKLYSFVADACTAKENYTLGLQVVDFGLKHLPNSARLHFERAMFLSSVDQLDNAKNDFELARSLAPDSEIAFVAAAQEAMFEGNVARAVSAAREGIGKGHENFMLLTLLGEALFRSGITPGQPEFDEARNALEKSVAERSNYLSSQLALGKLYLIAGRIDEATTHLEIARQLNPGNTAIYSNLAIAYRKEGKLPEAQDALATLVKLNQAQAEKIRETPGDRKASYAGTPREHDR
jgi:tetratricopeptide (TPR) repeat protein